MRKILNRSFVSLAAIAVACAFAWNMACGGGGEGGAAPVPPPPPPDPSAIALTVQPTQQFQTFEAWRATATGPYFSRSGGPSQLLPTALLNQMLDDLVFDLGLSGLRIEIHEKQAIEATNDNADPFSINTAGFDFTRTYEFVADNQLVDPVLKMQQVVLPFKSRVESRGEPFTSYVTLIYGYSGFPAHWHNAEEYAEVAEAYHVWARSTFNFTPTYWVIVNEPNSSFFGASKELENDVVATGARLRTRGFATKIQTVETVNAQSGNMQSVMSNAMARQYVGMLSYHGYDYSTGSVPPFGGRNTFRSTAQQYGPPTGMTEVCCKSGWDGSYTNALGWARDIYWNLTEGNASVWEPLAMMYTCSAAGCSSGGNSPIMIDRDFSRYFKLPAYYGLRQFSQRIRPGYRRVGVSCPSCTSNATVGQNLKPVAFQGPAGQMVVVIINDQSGSQAIALSGLPAGTYDISGVDPANTSGRTFSAQSVSAGQALNFTLPAQAIVTFVKR